MRRDSSRRISFKECIMELKPGRYRHFKGNEYELLGIARHSETMEEMVVYRALYGEGGCWGRPRSMWYEPVEYNGKTVRRSRWTGTVITVPDLFTSENEKSTAGIFLRCFFILPQCHSGPSPGSFLPRYR